MPQHKRLTLEKLHEYPGNPRRGDVAAIAESLQRNGQYRPLVVQASTMRVLDGNHTLQAARSLGWSSVDVYLVDADEQQAKRIVAAANRVADLGTYDNHDLVKLLQSIEDGLDGTGYQDENLATFLSNLDEGKFDPIEGNDPRLDRKNLCTCPNCGHEFEPTTYAAPA